MKRTLELIIPLTLGILFNSCESIADNSYGIRIRNNSSHSISVYGEYILPDTTLKQTEPEFIIVASGKSKILYDSYVDDLSLERFESEKLTVFIFNTDTLEEYNWETVVDDYNILKRYEIDKDDLIDMGGDITYH